MTETAAPDERPWWSIPASEPDFTIHQRLVAILSELGPIGKSAWNEQQKFHYRSHDDVMAALNPLLAKHGVFFAPSVIKRTTDQRATRSGGVMYEVNLCVRYTFFGAGGDHIEATTWGEGTDSGDKATNKAHTMALKNVLAQVFAISTHELSDSDSEADEATMGRASVQQGTGAGQQPRGRSQGRSAPPAALPPPRGLAPGAIRDKDALRAAYRALDPSVDWLGTVEPGMYHLWGVTDLADLDADKGEYAEFWIRLSNAQHRIFEAQGGADFPPPEDTVVLAALKWAFDDAPINTLVLTAEAEARLAEQSAALDAEAGQAASAPPEEGGDDGTTDDAAPAD